jgi:hypothetical protein
MNHPLKLLVFLLAGALFVACAMAFMGVDCGNDLNCSASKFALGYLLFGVVAAYTASIVRSVTVPVRPLVSGWLPAFPPLSVPRKISTRAPPVLP